MLASHVSLAGGGLLVWVYYLFYDNGDLAWISAGALCVAAALGLFMASSWVAVYRAKRASIRLERLSRVWDRSGIAVLDRPSPLHEGPPERNFPLPVVLGHGAFAAVTLTLVLLTALGVGGS